MQEDTETRGNGGAELVRTGSGSDLVNDDGVTNADPVLYDADASQRIPFSMEDDGVMYEVIYVLGPQKDGALIEYDKLCDRRVAPADEKETGERNAVQSTDESFGAALWLFEDRLEDVIGFGTAGEEKPENWRELIGTVNDKAAVIDQAYLAADIAPVPPAKPGQRRGWKHASVSTVLRVRALFEGYELTLSHERTEKPTANQLENFKRIMKHRWLVEGTRTGQGETRIPPKIQRLGTLYDQLGYVTSGYAGRVPLHHKMIVVIHDLSKAAEAVRKN